MIPEEKAQAIAFANRHGNITMETLSKVNQSVFTVCPSTPDVRPSMVFVFEMFLLRGAIIPTDRVVAWGAFPMCDKDCSVRIKLKLVHFLTIF